MDLGQFPQVFCAFCFRMRLTGVGLLFYALHSLGPFSKAVDGCGAIFVGVGLCVLPAFSSFFIVIGPLLFKAS